MKRTPRTKKTTRPTQRAPKKAAALPTRVARHALAAMLRVHKSTVYDLLQRADAPQADAKLHYDVEETLAYLKPLIKNSPQGGDPVVVNLKAEKLALEVSRLKREEAARAGQLVPLSQVHEELDRVIAEQDGLLRSLFEHELPAKYSGKTVEERRQLNVQAIERFVQAFKAGVAGITPPAKPANGTTGHA